MEDKLKQFKEWLEQQAEDSLLIEEGMTYKQCLVMFNSLFYNQQ